MITQFEMTWIDPKTEETRSAIIHDVDSVSATLRLLESVGPVRIVSVKSSRDLVQNQLRSLEVAKEKWDDFKEVQTKKIPFSQRLSAKMRAKRLAKKEPTNAVPARSDR